jgi:hypothetical protein
MDMLQVRAADPSPDPIGATKPKIRRSCELAFAVIFPLSGTDPGIQEKCRKHQFAATHRWFMESLQIQLVDAPWGPEPFGVPALAGPRAPPPPEGGTPNPRFMESRDAREFGAHLRHERRGTVGRSLRLSRAAHLRARVAGVGAPGGRALPRGSWVAAKILGPRTGTMNLGAAAARQSAADCARGRFWRRSHETPLQGQGSWETAMGFCPRMGTINNEGWSGTPKADRATAGSALLSHACIRAAAHRPSSRSRRRRRGVAGN